MLQLKKINFMFSLKAVKQVYHIFLSVLSLYSMFNFFRIKFSAGLWNLSERETQESQNMYSPSSIPVKHKHKP